MSTNPPFDLPGITITGDILERLHDIVFVHAADESFLYISPAIEPLLGYRPADVTQLTFGQVIAPEFAAEARRRTERQARGEPVAQPWDLQVYNSAGDRVWVQIVTTPVYDTDGKLTHVIGVARDIQGQKQLEEQVRAQNQRLEQLAEERGRSLAQSEEKYRGLVEDIGDILYAMDLSGILTYVSPAIEPVLGYIPDEAVGHSFLEFVDESDHEAIQRRVSEVLAGQLGPEEYRFRHKSGEIRWIRTSGRPIVDQGTPAGLRGVLVDVTESRRLQDQLRQWQKLQAIGTLAGGVAHEFNNILTAMVGHVEMVRMAEPHLATDAVQDLDAILVAAQRAKDLVRQILTFSRQADMEMVPVRLSAVVSETLRFLRVSLPATIDITQKIDVQSGLVLADVTQLRQVILNLGANAADAMGKTGGTLHVELAAVDTTRPWVRLTVTDTGHGMTGATLAQVFDPFFTTKEPGQGTGMGLAVVHGIVESHRGAIDVRSEPGKGTTVEIKLPTLEEQPAGSVPRNRSEPARGTGRILFVDDESGLVRTAVKLFSKLGYDVEGVSSGPAALAIARDPGQLLDLAITDQSMPQMTGIEVARELKRLRPGLPVILCTGYQDDEALRHAQDPSVDALVTKPYEPAHIAGLIQDMLGHTRPRH